MEAAFTRRLGRVHVLSPGDFTLARTWHQGGVPLAMVLAAVAQGSVGRSAPRSLTPLRRTIEAQAARAARAGFSVSHGPPQDAPRPTVTSDVWLASVAQRLAQLPDAAPWAALRPALERLVGLAVVPAAEREAALEAFSDTLGEAALEACPPERLAAWRRSLRGALTRQQGRVNAPSLDLARRRYERRWARALWGFPERD